MSQLTWKQLQELFKTCYYVWIDDVVYSPDRTTITVEDTTITVEHDEAHDYIDVVFREEDNSTVEVLGGVNLLKVVCSAGIVWSVKFLEAIDPTAA